LSQVKERDVKKVLPHRGFRTAETVNSGSPRKTGQSHVLLVFFCGETDPTAGLGITPWAVGF
jgi:hypothetical protein